jgi:hypothetical protein
VRTIRVRTTGEVLFRLRATGCGLRLVQRSWRFKIEPRQICAWRPISLLDRKADSGAIDLGDELVGSAKTLVFGDQDSRRGP